MMDKQRGGSVGKADSLRAGQARRARDSARIAQAGQSLIVAVIVLFLLLFLGGVFVALVARNLSNAQRASNVSSSSGYADAGLRYLDEQLTKSPEGADWRPVPDLLPPPGNPNATDPDYYWLQDPMDPATGQPKRDPDTGEMLGGYTRVSFGGPTPSQGNLGGRALVRITYEPDPPGVANPNPNSKYLKLESIGRVGSIDPRDPTTYGNSERAGLRRELVSYKAIGITDYLRFITNKNNKPVTAALGVPFQVFDRPVNGAVGAPVARDIVSQYVGPIRSNANLTFYGDNRFFLVPQRNDVIEVAGQISLNKVAPSATALANTDPSRVTVATPAAPNPAAPNVFPSASPAFSTLGALVRDNTPGEDRAGDPRSVPRLAPPIIDQETGPNGLTRYRALTRDSSPLAPRFTQDNPVGVSANFAGNIGWGSGMYINNINDVQRESENVVGAYSLRGDWLNPSTFKDNWRGDFTYVPPAVTITLTPRYMIITRGPDTRTEGRAQFRFRRPDTGAPFEADTEIRYTDGTLPPPAAGIAPGTALFEGYPAERPGTPQNPNSYYEGEYVIFAEGNVRIRGVVGGVDPETARAFLRHLTVVSNGTIYIDGNLLRDNITPDMTQFQEIKGRSSIALLARDYVAVNTTQFLAPSDALWSGESDSASGASTLQLDQTQQTWPFRLTLGPVDLIAGANTITNNAPPYALANPPAGVSPLSIFLRHNAAGAQGSGDPQNPQVLSATINLFVNESAANTPNLFNFNPPGALQYTLPSANYQDNVFAIDPAQLFPQNNFPYGNIPTALGLDNLLTVNYDVGVSDVAYRLTRVGIAPLDIRIEAFVYAQEGSFFIIPGPWFNPDPNDTYANYVAGSFRRADQDETGTAIKVDPKFPFYREPMDIRITFFGTIAENLPAQIGDQGAWLEKWGWIPSFYGSTGLPGPNNGAPLRALEPTVHGVQTGLNALPFKGSGLVFQFDDRAIMPYVRDANGNIVLGANGRPTPIRADAYGRTLPIAPRLPVAQGLLFTGERPVR